MEPRRTRTLTAIPLGRELPHGSSHLPADSTGRVNACLLGVAPGGGCRVSPCLHHPCGQHTQTRLCGPIPRLDPACAERIADGCYPPPCPMEPGLSSTRGTLSCNSGFSRAQRLSGRLQTGGPARQWYHPRASATATYDIRHATSPSARNGVRRSAPYSRSPGTRHGSRLRVIVPVLRGSP